MQVRLPPEQTNLLQELAYSGTVTGSSVFGGFTERSDIDIILRPSVDTSLLFDLDFIPGSLENEKIDLEFISAKVLINNSWYNFLIMQNESVYDEFIYATETMRMLRHKYKIDFSNKAKRINVFQTLRLFKRYNLSIKE